MLSPLPHVSSGFCSLSTWSAKATVFASQFAVMQPHVCLLVPQCHLGLGHRPHVGFDLLTLPATGYALSFPLSP